MFRLYFFKILASTPLVFLPIFFLFDLLSFGITCSPCTYFMLGWFTIALFLESIQILIVTNIALASFQSIVSQSPYPLLIGLMLTTLVWHIRSLLKVHSWQLHVYMLLVLTLIYGLYIPWLAGTSIFSSTCLILSFFANLVVITLLLKFYKGRSDSRL